MKPNPRDPNAKGAKAAKVKTLITSSAHISSPLRTEQNQRTGPQIRCASAFTSK